jgi:AcrR family transcriptional regulator
VPKVTQAHEREVRERIVLAAAQVFAEKGFHRATMQDVVRESGLSVGAIYTYFSGKDELFLATCDFTSEQGLRELGVRIAAGTNAAERLAIAVGLYVDAIDGSSSAPGMTGLVPAWAEVDTSPAARTVLVRRRDQLIMAGRLLVEEGIARGELPAWVDSEAMAGAYTALLDGLLLQRVEAGPAWRREDAERRARVILELALAAAGSDRPVLPDVPARPFEMAHAIVAEPGRAPDPARAEARPGRRAAARR